MHEGLFLYVGPFTLYVFSGVSRILTRAGELGRVYIYMRRGGDGV